MMLSKEAMIQAILAGEFERGASPAPPTGPAQTLTTETLRKLQAPFPRHLIPHETRATSRREGHEIKQYVLPRPLAEQRLTEVVGPTGYHDAYEVLSEDPPAVACHLTIQGVRRTGAGEGAHFEEAFDRALVAAARRFGVGWQLEQIGQFWIKRAIEPRAHEEGLLDLLSAEALPPTLPEGQDG